MLPFVGNNGGCVGGLMEQPPYLHHEQLEPSPTLLPWALGVKTRGFLPWTAWPGYLSFRMWCPLISSLFLQDPQTIEFGFREASFLQVLTGAGRRRGSVEVMPFTPPLTPEKCNSWPYFIPSLVTLQSLMSSYLSCKSVVVNRLRELRCTT